VSRMKRPTHPENQKLNEEETRIPEHQVCESKAAISKILDIAMSSIDVHHRLEEILSALSSVSWLESEGKGVLFMVSSRHQLVRMAEFGLDTRSDESCSRLAMGQCYCGRAAESGEIQFQQNVGGEHLGFCQHQPDHGQYNIPLKGARGEVIGVFCLIVAPGHRVFSEEMELVEMLGRVISAILQNKNLQLQMTINRIRRQHAQLDVLHKLVAASELRDNDTGDHIKRMSKYARIIGKHFGLETTQLDLLESAAPLHDIGKIGIPDEILLKPGRLTDEERSVMEQHTIIGGEILSGSHPLIKASREIALYHHECWDGTGYPQGLKGEDIPHFARVCAISDVFDALTMKRPYKEPWPIDKAVEWIVGKSGTMFDPDLIEPFLAGLQEILEVRSLFSSGEITTNDSLKTFDFSVDEVPGWRDSYSVGVEQIDRQHKYLLSLINRIQVATGEFDSQAIVEIVLDMQAYARFHFADEENLMEQLGFPGLADHRKIHEGFLEKADLFLDDLESAPVATVSEIARFLSDWLINHIMVTDAQYGLFFKQSRQQENDPAEEKEKGELLVLI